MDFSTTVLAFCLVSANVLICASGGLLDLLLGGNVNAPEQEQFNNFNNNDRQDMHSDYPDYNIGTNKDLDTSTDYGSFQQQNIPNKSGDFEEQTPDINQNENSGSQEYDPNYNSDEELRMGTPNEPLSNTVQSIVRQNAHFENNKNLNPTNKPLRNSYASSIPESTVKKVTPQKSKVNNIRAYIKNNTNNISETSSINNSDKQTNNKIANSAEQKYKNNINNESKGEVNRTGETILKHILKPITKRKFFFQAKPVVPKSNGTIDMETIYYVD